MSEAVEIEVGNQRRGGIDDVGQVQHHAGEPQAEESDGGIDAAVFGARVDPRHAVRIAAGEMGQEAGGLGHAQKSAGGAADFPGDHFPIQDAFRRRRGTGESVETGRAHRVEGARRQMRAVAGQAALRIMAAAKFPERDPQQPFFLRHFRPADLEADRGDFHRAAGLGDPVDEFEPSQFGPADFEPLARFFARSELQGAGPANHLADIGQLHPQLALTAGIHRHRHHPGPDLRRATEAGDVGGVEDPLRLGRQSGE